MINGTCGAGPGTNTPIVDQTWHVLNNAGVYYFSVADIDNALLTVTSYGYDSNTGTFSVIDSFKVYKGLRGKREGIQPGNHGRQVRP